ncbi:hypothetical protein BZG36_00999 [Bifiguratus adelaidae]|uniref:Rad4/PNGase transglutaminase-like fold domain-containing protein n=1 Tax=Bifiguratus adelaidae TaxID=1938954 RepID=A0A261Y6E2_9FUNG|nr:hypothetical protein BZG36_00999 [Bifiguratus adelaidae]
MSDVAREIGAKFCELRGYSGPNVTATLDPSIITHLANVLAKLWSEHSDGAMSPEGSRLVASITSYSDHVKRYEDRILLDKAMDYIPIDRLLDEAEEQCNNTHDLSLEDALVKRLMSWFKVDFFTWVDTLPCERCQSKTTVDGGLQPNREELTHGANRVEAHRAIGVEARLVIDTTDHIWTEIYSEQEGRWIHLDCCENAFDKPLLYSQGWVKSLTYVVAVSAEEVLDVTRRYVLDWPVVLKRRRWISEKKLAEIIGQLNDNKLRKLSPERRGVLLKRAEKEQIELQESENRQVSLDELQGRQSGSLDWRTSREETGAVSAHLSIPNETIPLLDFKDENHIQLSGSAKFIPQQDTTGESGRRFLVTSLLRLTDHPDQVGSAFHTNQIDLSKSFMLSFSFRIADRSGNPAFNGADGFAVVLQAESVQALGEGGFQLGYGGLKNSLAIEFDTYRSEDRANDPSGNHVSIHARRYPHANSAHHHYSLACTSSLPPLNNGLWYHVKIVFQGGIQIFLSDAVNNGSSYVCVLNAPKLSLLDYIPPKAWIGFTASTGGLFQCHDIRAIVCSRIEADQ